MIRKRWDVNGVSNSTTVAICLVSGGIIGYYGRGFRAGVNFWSFVLGLEVDLLPVDVLQLQLFHIDALNQADLLLIT